MKITCPTCGGKELLDDLSLVEADLYYSRGRLRGIRQTDSPKGPPALSCKTCLGQGWVTTEAYPSGLFYLHQTPDGFWVILDLVSSFPFEGHFADDPGVSGFVVIRTDLDQGWYPAISSGFIVLN